MITEEQRAAVIAAVNEMLDDSTCVMEWHVGTCSVNNHQTGLVDFRPTKGKTLTFKVHGGAVDSVEEAV